MNRAPVRILNLEPSPQDHERIKQQAALTGLPLLFERVAGRPEFEAAVKKGGFDLILADHGIAGCDGLATLETAQISLPTVPYLIVSGSIGEDRAVDCIAKGARGFVHKDRLERLPSAILEALGKPSDFNTGLATEERFIEMAEAIKDVYWVSAAGTGRMLYVSPAYEAIWGKSPGSLLSGSGAWPEAVFEEDRVTTDEARAKRLQSLPYSVEYRIARPDGSIRWIMERAFPVAHPLSGPSRVVGIAADITERKQLEMELHQAQRLELVGRLADSIAHDFNNQLTIISGYVSMLLDRENPPVGWVEPLKKVYTASRHATGLVQHLLLFSRKRSPKREVVDVNLEAENFAAMLRHLLGEKIVVNFEAAPEEPRAKVDVGMLEQAVINLAVNARDAMPSGGTLTIGVGVLARGGREPTHAPAPADGYVFVSVRDSGSGIPDDILPKIFEPFFTTKGKRRGTGLGLATAKDIASRHDGWIDVQTQVGSGSTFRICLPLTHADLEVPAARDLAQETSRRKRTILLVEDEANVREFAAAVLQQDGYALLQAKSSDAAVEVWKWHSARIDLLLTDVVLPGELSGPQLGAKLTSEKPQLKVILTTGYSRDTVESQSNEASSQFILNKPFTPKSLLQAVHKMLP